MGLQSRLSQGVEQEIKDLVQHREYLRDLTKLMALEEDEDVLTPSQIFGFIP